MYKYKLHDGSCSGEYEIGDKFIFTGDKSKAARAWSEEDLDGVFTLIYNDGTKCPKFKSESGDQQYEDWDLLSEYKENSVYKDLQELEDKLAAAQAIVEKLKKEKEAAEKANQEYELQGGDWFVRFWVNSTANTVTSANCASAGLERKTEALAQSALKQIRAFSRMLAYVDEHCPEYEPNWSKHNSYKSYVYFDHSENVWTYSENACNQHITVYMDKYTAQRLAADLNSGRFSLE
jgi:hypothetical protein